MSPPVGSVPTGPKGEEHSIEFKDVTTAIPHQNWNIIILNYANKLAYFA